jgi:hypothetical protein
MAYQGPVRPGENEQSFRDTGKSSKKEKVNLYINLDDINKPNAPVTVVPVDKPYTPPRRGGGGGGGSGGGGGVTTTPANEIFGTPETIKQTEASIGGVTPQQAKANPITKQQFQSKSISPTQAQVQKLYNLTTQERTTTNTIRNNKGQVVGGFTQTTKEQIQFDIKPKAKPQFGDRSKLKGYAQVGEESSSSIIEKGGKITALGSQQNKATDIIKGYGASVKDLVMSVPELGKAILKDPIAPVKIPLNVIKKVRTGAPEVGEAIRDKPFYVTGYAGGFVTGPKLIETVAIKSSDVVRTVKLKEIKSETVIAPEFTAGQKYPQVKKGQTAGELLEEFKVQFPGETKPAGFTASPNPLKGNTLGGGSSELQGLYQAPKISPTFLKVSKGESASNLENVKLFPTLRPTSFRVTPTRYELLKGVKSSQSNLLPIKTAQQSFTKNTKLGRAYIPFLKTEKEAVIPAGTLLKPKKTRYYFKFEGRRIPIKEYDTTEDVLNNVKAKPIQEVIGSYDYRIQEVTKVPKSLSYNKESSSSSMSYPTQRIYSSYRSYSKPISSAVSSLTSSSRSYGSSGSSRSSSPVSSSVSKAISSLTSSVSSNSKSSSNILSSSSRSSYGSSTSYNKIIKTPKPKPFTFNTMMGKDRNKKEQGYRAYYKRSGKIIYLSGIFSKGDALRKAERYTLGNLRATFGVSKSNMKVNAPMTNYKPNDNLFRDYRIVKGKRVSLQDEYIQRKGKRLSNAMEVKALQKARLM